ncbi:MAG TPA: cell envelope integrity protein TolA [Gammaproteobacteria bacterium]
MATSRHRAASVDPQRLWPWGYSVLLHVVLVLLLVLSFHWTSSSVASLGGTNPDAEPVKATVVDQSLINQQMAMLKSEQDKKHQEKQQLEQSITDLKQQQTSAQQQVNQQMADLKAQSDHLDKLKAEDDALAQRQKTADSAARRRQLAAEIANEESAHNAGLASAKQKWIALIQLKVNNNWIKPPNTPTDLKCTLTVTQVPGGTVTNAQMSSCNGDDAVVQSIITAAYRSSPLPAPPDPSLFDEGKVLNLNFNNKNQSP